MTDSQIKYQSHLETQRHNIATERQARSELEEAIRSHMTNEQIATSTLSETGRHNKATESLGIKSLQEETRHNKATEKENKRTNKAKEKETHRTNVANEAIRWDSNDISRMLANAEIPLKAANVKKVLNEMSRAGIDTMLKSKNPVVSTAGLVLQGVDVLTNPNTSKAQKDAAQKLLNDINKGKYNNSEFVTDFNNAWDATASDIKKLKEFVAGKYTKAAKSAAKTKSKVKNVTKNVQLKPIDH